LQSALIFVTIWPKPIGSGVTNRIVIICFAALRVTEVETVPKVFRVRSSAEVGPTTSPFTFHQRQPVSDATSTAPHVNFVQSLIWETKAVLADKMPTNSFAVGTFKYNFVSPRGSVLKPAGGHFGDGDGESFTFFFFFFLTGAFLTGAFFVTLAFGVGVTFFVALAFGVGVGLFVAATVEVSERPRNSAAKRAITLILNDHAPI
jgi:hypothetical protein